MFHCVFSTNIESDYIKLMSIQCKICIIVVFAVDTKGKNGSYRICRYAY